MSDENTTGFVYILKNDAMPGLIKIGKTSRDSSERAKELSAVTGVPTPFEVAFEVSSPRYEVLERHIHDRLAEHRYSPNREFFKYPVDKAIRLLKELNNESEDRMPLFERIFNFFKTFFQRKDRKTESPPEEKTAPRSTPSEDHRESNTESTATGRTENPAPVIYTGVKTVAMNTGHENREPTPNQTNGNPYYSETNGFYWATNHRGVASCIPQHITRIINDEELEIDATREELRHEISRLREEVVGLEDQQAAYKQEIHATSQKLMNKNEELAELNVQLEGLEVRLDGLVINKVARSSSAETSDESNGELFTMPDTADGPEPPSRESDEEIDLLLRRKAELEQALAKKNEVLSAKKIELAGLEVESQGPTEAELNPIATDTSPTRTLSTKNRASKINFVGATISTLFFIFLAIYLFIFYASAVDKAFFLNTEAIQAQLAQGTYGGVNDVVNPRALGKAFQGEWNLFVLMFPFVFLGFAIALDHFWEHGRWFAALLALLTLIFDSILAIQISQKIHQAKILMGQVTEAWEFSWADLNMWTVIFCGFVVSMLVSILYHVMLQRWQTAPPVEEKSGADNAHEAQIKNEKVQRETQLAVLKAEMENLRGEIESLNRQDSATEEKIKKVVRVPLDRQIAVLTIQQKNLENGIEQLKQASSEVDRKIENRHASIEEAEKQLNTRVINRNKMELQVSQFLNGWCHYIIQSTDSTADADTEIDRIKRIANETLDTYYQHTPHAVG